MLISGIWYQMSSQEYPILSEYVKYHAPSPFFRIATSTRWVPMVSTRPTTSPPPTRKRHLGDPWAENCQRGYFAWTAPELNLHTVIQNHTTDGWTWVKRKCGGTLIFWGQQRDRWKTVSLRGTLFSFTSGDVDFPKLCSNWVGMV